MLLGDIRQVQKVGKGTCDRQRRVDRHVGQLARELVEGMARLLGIATSRAFGQAADALHPLEQRISLLPPQGLAEQCSEQPHVIPKRLVGVFKQHRSNGFFRL